MKIRSMDLIFYLNFLHILQYLYDLGSLLRKWAFIALMNTEDSGKNRTFKRIIINMSRGKRIEPQENKQTNKISTEGKAVEGQKPQELGERVASPWPREDLGALCHLGKMAVPVSPRSISHEFAGSSPWSPKC